ncbi:acetoacetate decarboxylase family protein [Rhodococcus cerastii]|uniref:Acetoacetate decarboxylase family protein n=1 Tax=Rhodococcus cerastii TaxID=908616 RepID=A0ABU4D1L5_9NOCA|nr:acetoacetate decarboxylase family protein [Rhodococcus cerastii]MDV6303606.1 acetoacetate decarboxylase family protein [Rhodococcus cerastii]
MWSVTESDTDRTDWPVSPAAPWPANVRATIWWHRARSSDFAPVGAKTLPITMAMVVDYVTSPVGPYREILASPVLRRDVGRVPRMAVPFIAVDSATSVHGGRTNWHLPKVLAEFEGDVLGEAGASGDEWSVRTTSRAVGPQFPVLGSLGFAQPVSGGSAIATASLKGKARLARVEVDAKGPTLSRWMPSGTYFGLQIVTGSMRTGEARLVGQP